LKAYFLPKSGQNSDSKEMVAPGKGLKDDKQMSLKGIQIEEPAGIGVKAMSAEADWDVGGTLMTELLKGEMYLGF